jgi:hypothetical protein
MTSCEGGCAVIVGTATTFSVMGCVILCMACAVAIHCMRGEERPMATAVVVPNPVTEAVAIADEDPAECAPIAVVVAPSQTQPEPEPTEG